MAPLSQIIISLFLLCLSFTKIHAEPQLLNAKGFATAENSNYRLMKTEVLNVHNQLRANYSTAPLKWNETLAKSADKYAKKCRFEHSLLPNIGENLAVGYQSPKLASLAWAEEEVNYIPGEWSSKSGHFTQMVWKATSSIGCGWEECNDLLQKGMKQVLFVCHYYEQGNVVDADGRLSRGNIGERTEGSGYRPKTCDGNGRDCKKDTNGESGATSFEINYGLMIMASAILLGWLGFVPLVGMNL